MIKQRGFTIVEVFYLFVAIVGIAAVGGWIWNIVKIIQTCCQVIDGMLIARVIGVLVAPLGAVIGFF